MNAISNVSVEHHNNGNTTITGSFGASAGSFRCTRSGEGDNLTHHFDFKDGLFNDNSNFTIVGSWEFGEVVELLNMLNTSNIKF